MAGSNKKLNQSVETNYTDLSSPRNDSYDRLMTERDEEPVPVKTYKSARIRLLEDKYRKELDD